MDASLLADPSLWAVMGIGTAAWWSLSSRLDATNARIDTLFDHLGVPRPDPKRRG